MKTSSFLWMGLIGLMVLSSCEDERIISQSTTVNALTVSGEDFTDGETGTRAGYLVDGTGFHFSWTQGDTVGIYPLGGDQVAFPISSGEGSKTAQFDGGAWALRSTYSYAAYYPFSSDNYKVKETSIPVSYLGQVQNGNGSLDCLDRFDYQASVATQPDADGNVNIALKHLGCFVRFQLTMPNTDTYKSITLKSSKTPFVTTGTVDLTNDSIHITPVNTSQTISIDLNNILTTEQDSVLIVYAMLAPADMSDSNIDITIIGTKDSVYYMSVPGKKMFAGKAYSYNTGISHTEYQLSIEREALIAIYNALDGDNWTEKENWCSDKPVGEWYGISTNSTGYVNSIDLYNNNLSGIIPPEIGSFPYLAFLRLDDNDIRGSIPNELFMLSRLTALSLQNLHFDSGVIPEEINYLTNLESLNLSSHNDEIVFPNDVSGLTKLKDLHIGNSFTAGCKLASLDFVKDLVNLEWLDIYYMELTIPDCIGDLQNLNKLDIMNCTINGTLPSSIGDLSNLKTLNLRFNTVSCNIPKEIGKLVQLENLFIYGSSFCGNLPKEMGALINLQYFELGYNAFSGKLCEEIANLPICQKMWPDFYDHTGLNLIDCHFPAPDFDVNDLEGNQFLSDNLYADHKLTVLYEWATFCPEVDHYNTVIKGIFNKYNRDDVFVLGYSEQLSNLDENDAKQYITEQDFPWPNVFWYYDNINNIEYNRVFRITLFPLVCVIDENKQIIFNSYSDNIDGLDLFISDYLSPKEYYISSNYDADGSATTLQQSSTGTGINLILMGDAFSDRQIDNGTYAGVLQNAMNAFFSEEPYKSFKDYFNVYSVNVVSMTEGYEHSGQALGTGHGDAAYVYGNDAKVIEYTKKAISEDKLDDAVIIVMMNEDAYAGTCYMYDPVDGDYGRGTAIAYFPTNSITENFNGLVLHEAGGHGFAKLADEYAYEYNGTITQEAIDANKVNEPYGWWKNVDFTSDPTKVKWSTFISDSRYANENIGCYEGGLTYWSGVWRPTEESIMRYNTGRFNAPSRYAIWYRINKLAYGDSWNGTYEDFVEYDAINRTPSAVSRRTQSRRNYVEKPLPQLAPPVVVGHSWREAK